MKKIMTAVLMLTAIFSLIACEGSSGGGGDEGLVFVTDSGTCSAGFMSTFDEVKKMSVDILENILETDSSVFKQSLDQVILDTEKLRKAFEESGHSSCVGYSFMTQENLKIIEDRLYKAHDSFIDVRESIETQAQSQKTVSEENALMALEDGTEMCSFKVESAASNFTTQMKKLMKIVASNLRAPNKYYKYQVKKIMHVLASDCMVVANDLKEGQSVIRASEDRLHLIKGDEITAACAKLSSEENRY